MKHIGNNTEEAALKRSNLGYVLVLIAALMWGSIGIFVNGISAMGVSSQSMAAFRLLVGALILAPVLMFMGCRPDEGSTVAQGPLALFKASPKELVSCALVGIVGLAAANTCYYECMGEVGMSTASVLLYTSPVFGVALGRVLYREDVMPHTRIRKMTVQEAAPFSHEPLLKWQETVLTHRFRTQYPQAQSLLPRRWHPAMPPTGYPDTAHTMPLPPQAPHAPAAASRTD